jgi:hypothetical protein
MSVTSETMLLAASSSIIKSKWKPRLFNASYLCAIAIATIGWCTALLSGAISLTHWLFS